MTKHLLHGTHAGLSLILSHQIFMTKLRQRCHRAPLNAKVTEAPRAVTQGLCARKMQSQNLHLNLSYSQSHHMSMTVTSFMEINKKIISSISFILQMGKLESRNIIS